MSPAPHRLALHREIKIIRGSTRWHSPAASANFGAGRGLSRAEAKKICAAAKSGVDRSLTPRRILDAFLTSELIC